MSCRGYLGWRYLCNRPQHLHRLRHLRRRLPQRGDHSGITHGYNMEKHARSIMLRACFLGVSVRKLFNRFSRNNNSSSFFQRIASIPRNLYFPIISGKIRIRPHKNAIHWSCRSRHNNCSRLSSRLTDFFPINDLKSNSIRPYAHLFILEIHSIWQRSINILLLIAQINMIQIHYT